MGHMRRFEDLASGLSRGVYAALAGLLLGGLSLAIGLLFRYDPLIEQAPITALLLFVGFYVFNFRRWGE